MKDFSSYGYMQGPVRAMIQEDLNKMGIHHGTPANKRRSKANANTVSNNQAELCGIFGKPLPELETRPVPGQAYIRVPRLLLRSCNFLSHHLETEGLFRKSGSLARQKIIKSTLNEGNCIAEDSNPHDVASLLKQFLRELPEPLLTQDLYNAFILSQTLDLEEDKMQAVLLLVLCLPDINRHTLQFLTGFLHSVSEMSESNKMTASNLAVVIAPNIIRGSGNSNTTLEGSNIKLETMLVETLIQNSSELGLVPEDMSRRAHKMILELSGIWGVSQQEAAFKLPLKGKRKRSGSLSGILNSVFKQNKMTRSKHATTSSTSITASSASITASRPCTSSTLPRKSVSNQDLTETKTKSVPINGDLSFSTPCIRTPNTRPPLGTPLLSAQKRTALLRQTPVDPRKRPGKCQQQTLDCHSPVELDPPTKRSKLDTSPDIAEKRKNFKQRLSEGLTSRYRKSRLKRKLRSRAHCSSESSAVVANAVAMATPESTPLGDQDKRRKERTPVFCFKAKPGSFNDQNRRLAANGNNDLDSPIQPELIEYKPNMSDEENTPTCALMVQQKKLFPSPRLTDSTEDLRTINSPEQCFNRKYSNEPGFVPPRRSSRLLRRSAPVSASNNQLSERTPVLRRSSRLSGGEPNFAELPERSVSGSSYTASKMHSVSLNASNITPKTFSGSTKTFNGSTKTFPRSTSSAFQPFSPIRVSLNRIPSPKLSESDIAAATPPTILGTSQSFGGTTPTAIDGSPMVFGSTSAIAGSLAIGHESKASRRSSNGSKRGNSGVGLVVLDTQDSDNCYLDNTNHDRSFQDSSSHDNSYLDDSNHENSYHDNSYQDDSYHDNSYHDNSSDAPPDCTANLTELFTTRDITHIDVSLGVNELDNNFCRQLASQSSQSSHHTVFVDNVAGNAPKESIETANRAADNSSFFNESQWSKNASGCMNDTTHVTYITQNSSTSFLPGNISCHVDTDTSRTDFPKFGPPTILPEIILTERPPIKTPTLGTDSPKIFPDFTTSPNDTPTESSERGSSSLPTQFSLQSVLQSNQSPLQNLVFTSAGSSQSGSTDTLVTGSSSQSGSTNTLVAGSSIQSGSTNTLVAGSSNQSELTNRFISGSCSSQAGSASTLFGVSSSSNSDGRSYGSGIRSPPDVTRILTADSREGMGRNSTDNKLNQLSDWIGSSTRTPTCDTTDTSPATTPSRSPGAMPSVPPPGILPRARSSFPGISMEDVGSSQSAGETSSSGIDLMSRQSEMVSRQSDMVSRQSDAVSIISSSAPGTPLHIPEQHRTGSKQALVVNNLSNSSRFVITGSDIREGHADVTSSDVTMISSSQVVQDDQISSTVLGSPSKENIVPTRSEKRTPKSSQELDVTKINITPRTKISKGFTKNLADQWESMNRDDSGAGSTRSTRKTRIPIRTTSTRSAASGVTPPQRRQKPGKSRTQQDDENRTRNRPTITRATSAKTSDKPTRLVSRTKSDNLGKSNSRRPAWRF